MVARSRGPHYDISDLVRDCSVSGKVKVRTAARGDAKQYFNLETETRIVGFVSAGIFDDIKYENTGELDNGPDSGITFDSYIFRIGKKYVYFAFYLKPSSGIWIIKSFHPPTEGERAPSLTHSPFESLVELKK